MKAMTLIAPALAALMATALLIQLLRARQFIRHLSDEPNHRSLHVDPVPRIGGLAIISVVVTGFLVRLVTDLQGNDWRAEPELLVLMTGVTILGAVGLLDDARGLGPLSRGLTHVLCATVLCLAWLAGLPGDALPSASVAGVLVLVAGALTLALSANLYNFMDGSDGIAGAMAIAGFGALALAAPGGSLTSVIAALVVGASAGFLLFNWPPASIFMGDAGSVPLGFLAAGLGIHGTLHGYWPWWFAPACFMPFLFDAGVTLLRRVLAGHAPWQAHRSHAYQRLILSGVSHRAVALGVLLLGIGSAAVAATIRYQYGYVCFVGWAVIMSVHAGLYWWANGKHA